MLAILIIAGVIAAISLYDFFNTRNWQQVTSPVRNDAVFENRNRQYGAYRIRRDYNRNFILILLGMVGGVGVIYGAAATFRQPAKKESKVYVPQDTDTIVMDLKKDEPDIPEPKIPKHEQAQLVAQVVRFDDRISVTNIHTDEVPPIVDTSTNVGTIDHDGPNTGWTDPTLPSDGPGGTGTGGGNDDDDKDYTIAELDEPARYVGGNEARNLFLQKNLHFPEIPLQEGRGGKSYVKFIVNKTGKVEDVELAKRNPNCPECDKEAIRVVKLMPNWVPGKKKGKSVNSYFNLPLTFESKE